jgi:pimeloyl-ACP methyl ester carboxylesterase
MQRRYETIDGMAINLDDYGGAGDPVLLVHGLGGSAGNWSLVAPAVADFARTIAVDLPGHGRSGPARVHDLATHSRTVIAVIERLELPPVAIVGNSMGGLVAEMVAAERPDLLASLLLSSPATPPVTLSPPTSPSVAARLMVQSLPIVGPAVTAGRAARLGPRRQIEEMIRVVMEHPERLPQDALERAVELATLRRTMPWAAKAFAESGSSVRRMFVRRWEYFAMIDKIVAPTTLVFGSCDKVVIPASMRWLAQRRPDWRTVELSDTGHTVMLERPDIIVHELGRQLRTR